MSNKKSILKYILGIGLFLTGLAGCEDNNSLHQKYIDQGEIYYAGKCDSVKLFAGKERVKMTWQINADPRINRTVIYWNEGKDSVEIPVTRTEKGYIQMESIQQMKEGNYNFIFVTKDAKGNSSLDIAKSIQIYGPKYISYLSNRGLSIVETNNEWTIAWHSVESALVQYTTINYVDYTDPANPAPKSVSIANEDTMTPVSGIRRGDSFTVISTFLPKDGMDTVDAIPSNYTIL
jgi:predicted GH43/DUF377 family glycosyl hydrolase